MKPYLLIFAVCRIRQHKAVKSEFCLKPFPVFAVFSKERRILPSVVRREIGVTVGPVKAPFV